VLSSGCVRLPAENPAKFSAKAMQQAMVAIRGSTTLECVDHPGSWSHFITAAALR
jgi:hypothetical protein